MNRLLPVVLGILLFSGTAAAQQPPPGCATPEYRQFDFWVGDWTVTDSAGGTTYGTNLVTREESGCLLHEHWKGSQGGTGQSLNFYDRQGQYWQQVWVASGGDVLRLTGHFDGSSMVLEGDGPSPSGRPIRNRIAWTPQPDGRVRQVWSTSADSGASWKVGFDGWYRKQPGS
jgi:hypothetical protein